MAGMSIKKILKLQAQLAERLQTEKDPLSQQVIMEKFMTLRNVEKEILRRHRTVVFKLQKYK